MTFRKNNPKIGTYQLSPKLRPSPPASLKLAGFSFPNVSSLSPDSDWPDYLRLFLFLAMFTLRVHSDIKKVAKSLDALAKKQLPFATAQALTATAKNVQAAEVAAMKKMFKSPSAFTVRSVRVQGARKSKLEAMVFVMDAAAKYLIPYETGGSHKLASRALLNPKNIRLNQYGQLPKATIARLKARPDIFIGPVQTAHGTVNGVWQRSTAKPVIGSNGKRLRKANNTGRLKLLIRFGDALPVKQRWNYRDIARKVVAQTFRREMDKAVAAAIATAR